VHKIEELIVVRSARITDLQACRVIEDEAGQLFIDVGMHALDEDPPRAMRELEGALERADLWIAADQNDVPVAFALGERVDGQHHLAEIAVVPSWHRMGVGGHLIETMAGAAKARGGRYLSLTTFRDVPWNAPYYARLGFEEVHPRDHGPEMQAIFEHESALGLPDHVRIVMRRFL